MAQFFLALQVSEARCVGTANIYHQVISEGAEGPHPLKVICHCVSGQLVFAKIDAERFAC